jgi:hypothetical protein
MKIEALRLAPFAVAAVSGALAVAGCGAETSGSGNDFKIEGDVVLAGHNSVSINHIEVLKAEGEAEGWFEDGKIHKVHDNYRKCDGSWGGLKIHVAGTETTIEGRAESMADVKPGDSVRLEGKIRDSFTFCGKTDEWESRPVFDRLHELVPSKYRK